MKYTLIRSPRKTVAIHVKGGEVTVSVPEEMLQKDIDNLVLSKSDWITNILNKQREQLEKRGRFEVTYGSCILWRGNRYPIVGCEGVQAGFNNNAFHLPPNLESAQIKMACIEIYKQLIKTYITERAAHIALKMGVTFRNIKINNAKTRWGSCSTKGNLNFSWRLAFADDGVIDYVVAHELAHLIEMNHSIRFWAEVTKIMPTYQEQQAKLRQLQQWLANENWQ